MIDGVNRQHVLLGPRRGCYRVRLALRQAPSVRMSSIVRNARLSLLLEHYCCLTHGRLSRLSRSIVGIVSILQDHQEHQDHQDHQDRQDRQEKQEVTVTHVRPQSAGETGKSSPKQQPQQQRYHQVK